MIAGPTTAEEWRALGYEVSGAFRPNQDVTLWRPDDTCGNIMPTLWQGPLVPFHTFQTRDDEYRYLALP
jgi:hypothetical protein